MKKRDKKLAVSRETIRDLTTSGNDLAQMRKVLGGAAGDEFASCVPGGTTHCSNLC
jgi:hypothetical protein